MKRVKISHKFKKALSHGSLYTGKRQKDGIIVLRHFRRRLATVKKFNYLNLTFLAARAKEKNENEVYCYLLPFHDPLSETPGGGCFSEFRKFGF